jgi:hypothetical protein
MPSSIESHGHEDQTPDSGSMLARRKAAAAAEPTMNDRPRETLNGIADRWP